MYPVWLEGFAATGESQPARFCGEWPGGTFAEACAAWAAQADAGPDYRREDLFNADRLTWWGCRLFDNETDARRLFG